MIEGLKFLWWQLTRPQRNKLRCSIIESVESEPDFSTCLQKQAVVHYLKSNPLHHFPYPFTKRYDHRDYEVKYDPDSQLHYVVLNGKRLYWRPGRKEHRVAHDIAGLLEEQDLDSPHRYLVDGFNVGKEDIIADVGSAEGNFSIEVVETVKHIYLFEANPEWSRALEATFRPWKEKVTISNYLVGNECKENFITLDRFFEDKEAPSFYKLDVEGYEADVINGGRNTIARAKDPKIAVCTYHRQEDETNLRTLLEGLDFEMEPSQGYMLLYRAPNFGPPYLRRGLLRAIRP